MRLGGRIAYCVLRRTAQVTLVVKTIAYCVEPLGSRWS